MQSLAEQGRGISSSRSLQLTVCENIVPEFLALSPSHCSALGLVTGGGFCRFSLIFPIRITRLGLLVSTHTMTIRGGEKRIVMFVEWHIWASSTKCKCASFQWKTEVLISLKYTY